ncbi:MAG: hypothetical protein LQ338_001397 [Usnochroma carphineum]|nr:MAG: hypothetical protein LQ338_001397 [Usnochroma carphineum]
MSGNLVQWQVDLPGLSSLVLNMGAAGLKKFAQAGVDIHTLLCMGEIAEVCPASLEYRKEINACRQQQRKNSIWLYKMVEIGTASNFLADELLKKRAGENIVALMSTILPILTEDDCDSFVLRLFEACEVDMDKTPGLGQLQAFHDSILPLAQKLAFKDRTYQYFVWLKQFHQQVPQDSGGSVPDIETLVQVVKMLQKVVTEDSSSYNLAYRGWEGAAWVIAYARHVLGLPVCVLRTQQDSVPINGQYQNSKVYIYLLDPDKRCELVASGNTPDLVVRTAAVWHTRWVIDLENVSLKSLYLPDDPTSAEAASVIIRSLALDFTIQRTTNLALRQSWVLHDGNKLKSYAIFCLPQLLRRTLKIIAAMGFSVSADIEPDTNSWREFFRVEDYGESIIQFKPGHKWVQYFPLRLGGRFDESFERESLRLVWRMFTIADAISCLVFSDWGEKLSLVSARFLECGLPKGFASGKLGEEKDALGNTRMSFHRELRETCRISTLTHALMFIVTGEAVTPSGTTTALECQNVVIARAAAAQTSVNFDAVFIHFYRGQITMLGQRRTEIRALSRPFVIESQGPPTLKITDPNGMLEIYPRNMFSDMTIKSMSRLARASIDVTRSLARSNQVDEFSGPSFVDDKILDVLVTGNCPHPYDGVVSVVPAGNEGVGAGFHVGVHPGVIFTNSESAIHFQGVDGNTCGQWASMHYGAIGDSSAGDNYIYHQYRILQRGMCTSCVYDYVKSQYQRMRSGRRAVVHVIPGRGMEVMMDGGGQS